MDSETRAAVERFIKPLYQDLDGVSRLDEVERVSTIARRLYDPPNPQESRTFELLLIMQRLGSWLGRVGNISRLALGSGGQLSEQELRAIGHLLQTLDRPGHPATVALAAALRIDDAGVRGLTARMAAARREGSSPIEVARAELAEDVVVPDWMPARGQAWLQRRSERRRAVCRSLLEEVRLDDLD